MWDISNAYKFFILQGYAFQLLRYFDCDQSKNCKQITLIIWNIGSTYTFSYKIKYWVHDQSCGIIFLMLNLFTEQYEWQIWKKIYTRVNWQKCNPHASVMRIFVHYSTILRFSYVLRLLLKFIENIFHKYWYPRLFINIACS